MLKIKKIIALSLVFLLFFTTIGANALKITTSRNESQKSELISLDFSFDMPVVEEFVEDEQVLTKVTLRGCDVTQWPGLPVLPKKVVRVLIPFNSYVESIDIETYNMDMISNIGDIELGADTFYPLGFDDLSMSIVDPVNSIVTFNDQNDKNSESQFYDKTSVFPGEFFSTDGIQFKYGFPILTVYLYPVQYDPIVGTLSYYRNMILKIKTVKDESIPIPDLYRGLQSDFEAVERIVDNPSTVRNQLNSKSKDCLISAMDSSYDGDMLIVTTNNLKNAPGPNNLQALADAHRDLQGMNVYIKTVESIYREYNSNHVSEWPWERNKCYQIRECVKDYYKNKNVNYVLLVGDDDYNFRLGFVWPMLCSPLIRDENIPDDNEVPTFQLYLYTMRSKNGYDEPDIDGPIDLIYDHFIEFGDGDGDRHNIDVIYPDHMTAASDLPYGCLDDFSEDDNYPFPDCYRGQFWGLLFKNYPDHPPHFRDLLAEVYVGRAPVSNTNDLKNFVKKTLSYMNAPVSNYNKVLMAGELAFRTYDGTITWGGNFLDDLINTCDGYGFQTEGIPAEDSSQSNSGSTASYTIEKLYERTEANHVWTGSKIVDEINNGNINYINHIGHGNVIADMKIGIPGLLSLTRPEFREIFTEVNGLRNDEYFIVYSQGCFAGAFDAGGDEYFPYSRDSIAEHFTVKNEYGGVAFIGNSHLGFYYQGTTDGPSQRFNREFLDAIFREGKTRLGVANQDSKEDNFERTDNFISLCVYYCLNLLGDPALEFKGAGDYIPDGSDDPNGSDDSDEPDSKSEINNIISKIWDLEIFKKLKQFFF